MSKACSVDFSEVEQLRKQVEQMAEFDKKGFLHETVEAIAQELLTNVIKRTPVDTGTLRRAWTKTNVVDHGSYVEIIVYNPTEYAEWVEKGHRQEVGRYVPAIGKKLVKDRVLGKFFLLKSEIETESEMNKIIRIRLERVLKRMLKC